MSVYRLVDVVIALAGRVHIGRPLIVFNEEDQRDQLVDHFTPFVVNRERGGHEFAEHAHKSREYLCLIRAWVPRVHENSSGWLIRPMWPTLGSESQNRARVDRLAAYADGSDDHATLSALGVRDALVARARIIRALVLNGAEGHRRMAQSLPKPDFMSVHQVNHVLNEMTLCDLWQNLETMRARCELRTRQLGRECCNEWHAWRAYEENYHHAAVAYVWAVGYLFDVIPMFEALHAAANDSDDEDDEDDGLEYDEDDEEKWPTVSCCDPVFSNEFTGDDLSGDECFICMGGNDFCRLGRLDCGHVFGEACLLRWFEGLDAQGLPRACPMCRKLPYNGEAFACHVCVKTGFEVQLYHLNGPCRCDTVYCHAHLPGRDYPCGSCRMHYQE
jgi:hypothetical protein